MAAEEGLIRAVQARTQSALQCQSDAAIAAADIARLHNQRRHVCGTSWDLAKIASATVRCSLAGSAGGAPCPGLLELVAVGFRCSPHGMGQLLADAATTRAYVEKLSSEPHPFSESDPRGGTAMEGALVLLSLLSLWHRIESLSRCTWEQYRALVEFLARAIPPLARAAQTAASGPSPLPGAKSRSPTPEPVITSAVAPLVTYSRCWVGNLLEYGLRSDAAHACDTALLLGSTLSAEPQDGGGVASIGLTAGGESAIRQQWNALRGQVLAETKEATDGLCGALRAIWLGSVQPVLTRAFSHEPPPLCDAFFRPPALSAQACSYLGHDVLPQLHRTSSSEAVGDAFNRIINFFEVDTMVRCACTSGAVQASSSSSSLTVDEYRRFLRPIIAAALRTERYAQAEQLLSLCASSLECTGGADAVHRAIEQWLSRLHAFTAPEHMRGAATDKARSARCNALRHPRLEHAPCACIQWPLLVRQAADTLDLSAGLDVLVAACDLHELRLVCDAVLLLTESGASTAPAPTNQWPRQLLEDSFSPPFLLRGLASVAHLLLNNGDAMTARLYTTRLALCVARFSCPEGLRLLLQLLCRMGRTLTMDQCLLGCGPKGHSAHAQWDAIHYALEHLLPCSPKRCYAVGGILWKDYSQESSGSTTEPATDCVSFTRVTVRLSGDDVLVQRCWDDAEELCTRHASILLEGKRLRLQDLRSRLLAVMEANRQHLAVGTGGATRLGKEAEGRNEDHMSNERVRGDCDCLARSTSEVANAAVPTVQGGGDDGASVHALKLQWWRQRFELDGKLHCIVQDMEQLLGVSMAFFAGEPCVAAQRSAWHHAGKLAALLPRSATAQSGNDSQRSLHAMCAVMLQGLPFLLPSAATAASSAHSTTVNESTSTRQQSGASSQPSTSPDEAPPRRQYSLVDRLPFCPAHVRCARSSGSSGSVRGMSCLPCRETVRKLCHALETAVLSECQDVVNDPCAVAVQCEEAVVAVLEEMCGAVGKECDGDGHVNVLSLRRRHVSLLIDSVLHGLPWEGLHPLRLGSCSRARWQPHPSASKTGAECAVEHTHLLVDPAAVPHADKLRRLLARHPTWTAEFHSTAAAADRGLSSDSAASPALLNRLCGADSGVYVYLGHRRGEEFLSSEQLYSCCGYRSEDVHPPALTMLMGCSSARTVGNRLFERVGMPSAYLHAGFRAFIGCLWDITDGEIDQLARVFLQLAAASVETQTPLTAGEALSAARSACKLPFLSAASTVLYGANVVFVKSSLPSSCVSS